jgi:hypothetical protein
MTAKAYFAVKLLLPEYALRFWEEPAITCTCLALGGKIPLPSCMIDNLALELSFLFLETQGDRFLIDCSGILIRF